MVSSTTVNLSIFSTQFRNSMTHVTTLGIHTKKVSDQKDAFLQFNTFFLLLLTQLRAEKKGLTNIEKKT